MTQPNSSENRSSPQPDAIDTRSPSIGRNMLANRSLWIVVCSALLVRGAVLSYSNDSLQQDPDAYQAIASTLHTTGTFGLTAPDGQVIPTAFRPPLYPTILSTFVNSTGIPDTRLIALLHLLAGLMTAVFCYGGTRNLLLSHTNEIKTERVSVIAALLVTIDPILVQQSSFAMTETIAACIVSSIYWQWTQQIKEAPRWKSRFTLGILLCLAYLCRPTFLAWSVLLLGGEILWHLVSKKYRTSRLGKKEVLKLFLPVVLIAVTVMTWAERNRRATGYPVWATTHGGYTLLLGNNPLFYRHLETGGSFQRWDATDFTRAYAFRFGEDGRTEGFWLQPRSPDQVPKPPDASLSEHGDDQWSYQAAKATISRAPTTFIQACLNRIYRLWTPLPFETSGRTSTKRVIISSYYTLLYIAAAIGMSGMFLGGKPLNLWPTFSLIAALTIIHAFYWSNLRMRAPAMPLIAICAANAFAWQPKSSSQVQNVAHT